MTTLMILAGGTGGHVFPALAVATQLRREGFGVVWLGTERGLEARVVPAAGIEMEWVNIRGLRRRSIAELMLLPLRLSGAMWQAWRAFNRRRPEVVLAMGGFVAGPGGLVARLTRTPLIVHEQNAVPGLTNRYLARIATHVLCGFPNAFGASGKYVGNPVRAEIAALEPPAARYAARSGPCRVLVIGGSQGARIFNRVLPEALAAIAADKRPEIRHQTGNAAFAETQTRYAELGVAATPLAFIDDMAAQYAWADVVICRAGAMTVAELAAAGVAAVLVPFAAATDDHQTANARFLVASGAAELLPESEFTPARVAQLLTTFTDARPRLATMAQAARASAVTDAVASVANVCRPYLEVARA